VLGSPAEAALEAGYAAPAWKVAALSAALGQLPTVEARALGGGNVVYVRETTGRTGELADRGGEGVRSCHSVTSRRPSSSAPASANAAT